MSKVELEQWWVGKVENDIGRTVPKIEEYGTRDLTAMGHMLATIKGIPLKDDQAAIYGCMFYAMGKCARALAALERSEMPSEDTLFDLSIYAMMARSFKERGVL